jgi:hypothetical protein
VTDHPSEHTQATASTTSDATGAEPLDEPVDERTEVPDPPEGADDGRAVGESADVEPGGGADSRQHGSGPAEGPPEVERLTAAVAELDELGRLPVPEHVARYDALHSELSEALASIDEV